MRAARGCGGMQSRASRSGGKEQQYPGKLQYTRRHSHTCLLKSSDRRRPIRTASANRKRRRSNALVNRVAGQFHGKKVTQVHFCGAEWTIEVPKGSGISLLLGSVGGLGFGGGSGAVAVLAIFGRGLIEENGFFR